MQVPFRRYMKEPGPICGSASPQSEDRPSHKEIPIATDWRTSAHNRTDGRTEGNTQTQWRNAQRTVWFVIFATAAPVDLMLESAGAGEARRRKVAVCLRVD